jgi:opacity protein-like surface antigen
LISAVAVAAVAIMAFASVASADVAHYQPTNSLTATTVYNGVTYVHKYTLTTHPLENSFAGVNSANSPVGINESVSGRLTGSKITISGAYHDGSGYTWNYDGPLTGGTGSDSLGLKWHISFTTDASFTTVTPYHLNNNDAEWGPDSCSGLHTVISGMKASTTDTFTCTSTPASP